MTVLRFRNHTLLVADTILQKTLTLAGRAAQSSAPILLCGESGTGKELIARYIHEKSRRCHGNFVSINCAAIPEGLLEAELFGYEKGAFTGAVLGRRGKFEKANHGTLLLDEISEMPLMLQAKLLRVLQEGEVDRLAGERPISIDTRIIATTNQDPLSLIESGVFREDLFYRLNVLRIDCMPLRGRQRAVVNLSQEILRELAITERMESPGLSPEALQKLVEYQWPGNVRELKNVIHRAFILADGSMIEEQHLSALRERKPTDRSCRPDSLFEVEKVHILEMLERTSGNRTQAAKLLGITVRTLRNKLKLYGSPA